MNNAQPGDTITFDPAIFSTNQTITLSSGPIIIPNGRDLTIDGPGPSLLTISGSNSDRIFVIDTTNDAPTVRIQDMTLTNGLANSPSINGQGRIGGGAIQSDYQADLTIENVVFQSNEATEVGGAIHSPFDAVLTVLNSQFINNVSTASNDEQGGGAIFFQGPNQLSVSDSMFSGNQGINGGAINNLTGRVVIERSSFTNNNVLAAVFATGEPRASLRGYGGAIYSDRVSPASDPTGGILQLIDSTFQNNSARAAGGALYLFTGGSDGLEVTRSTFADNSTIGLPGGEDGNGGALELQSNEINQGATIVESTFSGNRSVDRGGAIRARNFDPFVVTNSTFDNNGTTREFTGSFNGGLGGAFILSGATATVDALITNVTFTDNFSTWVGGAISTGNNNNLVLNNSIFSGNTAQQGSDRQVACNVQATGSNNLLFSGNGSGSCLNQITSTVTDDPLLNPLATNGGSTPTRALQSGSPAIDAANGANCPVTDQRGVSRSVPCDIGAYEF